MTSQRLYDAWVDVDRATGGHWGGAHRLRRAMDEFQAAALAALIEYAIDRDSRQTHAEVQACAHKSGRDCPGDLLGGGCHNHAAHRAWVNLYNTELFERADRRARGVSVKPHPRRNGGV